MNEELTHDFREVTDLDPKPIVERETHTDFQTRYRVLMGGLMDWVLSEVSLYNNQFHFKTFMKQCDHLGKRFLIHEELHHIDEIRFVFWHRYQYKMKVMKQHLRNKTRQQSMKDLVRMGF